MKIIRYFLVLMFFSVSNSYALNFTNGVSLIEGMYSDAEEEFSWTLDDLSTNHNVINRGYTNLGTGNVYYALYSDMNIRSFDMSTNTYLGTYPLTSYSEMATLASEEPVAAEQIAGLYGETYTPYTDPSTIVIRNNAVYAQYDEYNENYGCLQQHPLRYGDIDGDGTAEIALNLAYDWVVFSTTLNKVIFSARWDLSDEIKQSEEAQFEVTRSGTSAPQHIATSGADHRLREVLPATRSYAKLYFGNFDGDNAYDILMWRKQYVSRLVDDPIKGFRLNAEGYIHYEKVNGEYKLQDTPKETVKGWLTTANHTWQKGYPDKSECVGQEGQPIAEMVDPLLNDPDVLQ